MPLQDKHFKEDVGSTDKNAHWCFKPLIRCTENAVVGEKKDSWWNLVFGKVFVWM